MLKYCKTGKNIEKHKKY